MPASVVIELKRKYVKTLEVDLENAYKELEGCTGGMERGRIRRSINVLEQEINEVTAELEAEPARSPIAMSEPYDQYDKYARQWDEHWHKIDFEQVNPIIDQVYARLKHQAGAALFFVDNGEAMAAGLCARHIQAALEARWVRYQKDVTVEFADGEHIDALTLLSKLNYHFNINQPPTGTDENVQCIVDRLCESVMAGNVVFIQLTIGGLIDQLPSDFVQWFLEKFWNVLVQKVVKFKKPNVRVIGIIAVQVKLSAQLPSEYRASLDDVSSTKLIELPLDNWQADQIEAWMLNYSQLIPSPLSSDEVNARARTIYNNSESGRPQLVIQTMKKSFSQLVSQIIASHDPKVEAFP